jgi:hypothetical protein
MNYKPVHRTFSKNKQDSAISAALKRMLRHSDIPGGEKILSRVFNTMFDPIAELHVVQLPTPDATHSRSIRYYRELGDLCA